MSIYDPTIGSGGMLIQSRDYLRECGHEPRHLALYGQKKMGSTWSICKMNMLLHGIAHADIRQEDTNDRKHVLFINADREYREGKAQKFLRPEDIDKIVHVYWEGRDLNAYARDVPKEEIATEDF